MSTQPILREKKLGRVRLFAD